MRLSFVFFFPCRFFFLFLSLFIVFTRCLDGWRWRADWPGKTGATGFFLSNFVLFLFVCLFRFFLLWLTFVKRFLFLFLFARSSPVVGRSRARRVSQRIGRFHRRDRFPNFFGGGRYPKRLKGGITPKGGFFFLFHLLKRVAFSCRFQFVDDVFTHQGYRVLSSTTDVYRVLLYNKTRLNVVWVGLTRFNWVLPGFTGFYRVLLGFTGFYWVLPSLTWFYWVLLGFTEF